MIGDYKDLQESVEEIIVRSQDYPFDINCTELMNKWKEAKAPFITLFGGKLIVRSETPITVTLSEEQRSRRFKEFLSALDENDVLNEDLESFLCINKDGFFDNKVVLPYPSKHISAGSKILRSFKHFISAPEVTRWAQDTASRYIQENKIEGYLYLSVDPRDFLTLSENNANWSSCHSLDGDYRAGNLSYMTDSSTVIAYLASEKQEKLKCLPMGMKWNSKKWRMLVHTDLKNCIYYNRQYPYDCSTLVDAVHEMIAAMLPEVTFSEPRDFGYKIVSFPTSGQTMLNYNQINAGGRSFDMRDVIDASDYRGYCDLISSSTYTPIVAVNQPLLDEHSDIYATNASSLFEELQSFRNIFGLKVGGTVPCPCCGENTIKREDSLLCEECIAVHDADEDFFLTCDSCYHRIYEEDEIMFVNGIPYCKSCYEAMLREDEITLEEDEDIG